MRMIDCECVVTHEQEATTMLQSHNSTSYSMSELLSDFPTHCLFSKML
mgnify:CR=1 FL=1